MKIIDLETLSNLFDLDVYVLAELLNIDLDIYSQLTEYEN